MHDELRTGVDRPRGSQYVWLVAIITLMAIAGYWYRRDAAPLRFEAESSSPTSTSTR